MCSGSVLCSHELFFIVSEGNLLMFRSATVFQDNMPVLRFHYLTLFIFFASLCLSFSLIKIHTDTHTHTRTCVYVCTRVQMCCSLCLLLFVLPQGDCYLMEWSDWSSCASVCVKGAALDYVSVQVRSRAVLAQEPENLQLCPDQQWESRPCTGQVSPVPNTRVPLMISQLC